MGKENSYTQQRDGREKQNPGKETPSTYLALELFAPSSARISSFAFHLELLSRSTIHLLQPHPPLEPESKVLFALLVSFLIRNFWFICSIKDVERIKSFKASTSASAVKEKKQCTEIELLSLLLYFFWLCS